MVRQTSIDAYNEIELRGLLTGRRWEIYRALFRGPGCETANELFARTRGSSRINQANFPARLNELREMGVVRECGTKVCTITGMEVIAWDVTDRLPVKIPKPTQTKCPYCKGKGVIEQGRLL